MLLLALYCTYCAPTPVLNTTHSSQVMLWGRKRAMSGYLVNVLRVFWTLTVHWGQRSAPHLWDRLDRPHCIWWSDQTVPKNHIFFSVGSPSSLLPLQCSATKGTSSSLTGFVANKWILIPDSANISTPRPQQYWPEFIGNGKEVFRRQFLKN